MQATNDNTASHDLGVSDALVANMRTGWAAPPVPDAKVAEVAPFAAARRTRLSAAFPGSPLVVASGSAPVRNNDVDYAFRPASDFYWLTGCAEPDAVLVMVPTAGSHHATLFVRPRSSREAGDEFYRDRRYGELWTGPRPGVEETATTLDVECRPLADLPSVLAPFADRRTLGEDADLAAVCSELRLVKDAWEIEQLRDAIAATVRGFTDVVTELPQAVLTSERWVEGTFWRRARVEGNDVGYGTIAASGPNACVLHWMRDDGPVRPGDLLLLDAGVENRNFYTADVTRTIPVSGAFSADQRKVYDLVLAAADAGMAAVRPGAAFADYHDAAMAVIARGLIGWGLLPPSAEGTDLHRRYTLHRAGHMLGLDVHDCAHARNEAYLGGTLAVGQVLTVEPGLYFQPDDLTVPPELRGIGVRIEDDVLVTPDGCENLSAALPRRADDVEAWMAQVS